MSTTERPPTRIGPTGDIEVRVTVQPVIDESGRMTAIGLTVGTEGVEMDIDFAERLCKALHAAIHDVRMGRIIR